MIANRESAQVEGNGDKHIRFVESQDENHMSAVIQPIISAGDAIGSVIIASGKKEIGDAEKKMAQMAAVFLGKQMEN